MFKQFPRRIALQFMSAAASLASLRASRIAIAQDPETHSASSTLPLVGHWHKTHNRVWLGAEFWANPMEDWRIVDGGAECQSTSGNRNVHLLTHHITDASAPFAMSVRVTRVERKQQDGGAGFLIGVRSDINEYRSNSFAKNGIHAGVRDGRLVVGRKSVAIPGGANSKDVVLELAGQPSGDGYALTLTAKSPDSGETLGTVKHSVARDAILGNVAIVNNFGIGEQVKNGARYRFTDLRAAGDAFTIDESHAFGPILWSMYSLSDSRSDDGFVMKITALTGPLGAGDHPSVELLVERGGEWKSLGEANLDTDAWVATHRIANWDASRDTPYRLVYRERHTDGSETSSEWRGKVRANPTGRPLRLAALTCQNDYAFPYQPVADNLAKLDPDMLYFSGDQIYENHGGYGIIREPAEPAILNYLRKFYQFGWAFGEAMRDRPTLCIPDDHDVFQGNIWGEAGAVMQGIDQGASSKGGYRQPARMVNVVHRSCVSHHPDIFDPTPVKQDISVYFGDMVYGGVSFAILGDRQWKSGPERVDTGSGRADHVLDPDFDCTALDKPGLVLLGDRQEAFLEHWAGDWRGHTMKVLLSQTVFAGVATHHGEYDGYLKGDLDSGAWPQTPRNRAIGILRKSKALHVNGDQHLTTLCQYGFEKQRDSNWSFCTPAIAVGYPRWWRPDELGIAHANRPQHGLGDTGEYVDSFGNLVYVYAVGNPEVATEKNRYDRAHQKGSGFGMVTIDTEKRTYYLESFRFLIDATDGKPSNQFPGWPVTIRQDENIGDNRIE